MENITNDINNIDNIKDIIIKALDYYDKNNYKYKKYIYKSKVEFFDNSKEVKFYYNDNDIFKANYQLAGYHDIQNNIWIWGWLLPINNKNTSLARDLLSYGLKLDIDTISNEQNFIKNLLLNSRYMVTDTIGMDINMAIFSYILKEKILFIYSQTINQINFYYFIVE